MQIVAHPAFSLEPSKLVLYTRFDRVSTDPAAEFVRSRVGDARQLVRSFHNFEISDGAYRNLRRKINWLYTLSRKRDIKTWANAQIFNFRCSFLTFTLPSKQVHPTSYITKNMFNNLLVLFRERFGMVNYVWRLEFQKNGNVHYHLVTDSFVEWRTMRKLWNQILERHGYIEPYRAKHKAMKLQDYVKRYSNNGHSDFDRLKKAYMAGIGSKWSDPNSVDARSVVSKKAIAAYVSKYFSKSSKTGCKCNPLDNEDNSKGLRLWYCSQSLSKLATISDYLAHVRFNIEDFVRCVSGFRRVVTKYAVLYFFDVGNASGYIRSFFNGLFKDYAKKQGYIPV